MLNVVMLNVVMLNVVAPFMILDLSISYENCVNIHESWKKMEKKFFFVAKVIKWNEKISNNKKYRKKNFYWQFPERGHTLSYQFCQVWVKIELSLSHVWFMYKLSLSKISVKFELCLVWVSFFKYHLTLSLIFEKLKLSWS